MQISTWLWQWMERRHRSPAPADPLAQFAKLTVERLEDRRVLSATLASGMAPNVVVDISGNDTVTVSVNDTNHLIITDVDENGIVTEFDFALADIDSLTFNGDGGTQSVIFAGTNPIDVAALNITNGVENISFQQDVIAAEGGVQVFALNDITFAAGADLLSTAGDINLSAANDLLMDATSSITADDPGDSWTVSLSAGDDLTVGMIHAGLGVTLEAGATSLDGSLLHVDGCITADVGDVSIDGADDIAFSAAGDVTVLDGSLTVIAGGDVGDDLTMSDGTVFSVSNSLAGSVELSAAGDIALGEITGTNLDRVTILSIDGAITDGTIAETANITALQLSMFAATGIGIGDALNTEVTALESTTTTGGIAIDNVGNLTIGGVDIDLTGVEVNTSGTIAITTTGALTLLESITGPDDIRLSANALTVSDTVAVSTTDGNIALTADAIDLAAMAVIDAGSHTVTITSASTGIAIDLGGADDIGVLGLTNAELNTITAGTLVIGNATAGTITVTDSLSPASVATLELITGADIVDGHLNGTDIAVTNLVLNAATGIGSGDALETQVTNLAFRNTTSGLVEIANSGALTIGFVGMLDGTSGNELGNFGGAATFISAASPITIAADVTSVGSMTFTAGESAGVGDDLTIDAGVTVSVIGGGNLLTLQAGDDVVLNGTAVANSGSVIVAAGFNDLDSDGSVALDGMITALQFVQFATITGMDDGATGTITAAELEILGSGDVLLDNNHAVGTIAANLNGALTYHSTNGFVVGIVNGTTGITLTQGGATLELAAASGAIGFEQNVTTDGFQNYATAVELLADVSLNAGSGDIQFAQAVDGTFALSITGGNNVTFAGAVGSSAELAAIDINVGGTVAVSNSVQLGQDETHPGTFSVFANEFVLNGSIDTQNADPLGGGGVLIFANSITLGGSITTDEGNVDFIGDVFLAANTTINTETGSVSFLNAIDGVAGGESLSVTSTAGGVILVSGAVGANVAIGALTLSSTAPAGLITLQNGVISIDDVTLSAESVLIDGAIDTTAAAAGLGNVVITSTFLTALTQNITTNDGDITLNGFTRLDQSITLQTTRGDVFINGALDSNDLGGAPLDGLTIIATIGSVHLQADIGTGTTPGSDTDGLAFLDITAGDALYACGTWIIATNVTFTPAVSLCGDLSITATGDVTFQQTVDGDGIAASTQLTIQADNVEFVGAIGDSTPLTGLTINAAGNISAGAAITTDQTIDLTANGAIGIHLVGPITSQTGSVLLLADGTGDIDVDAAILAAQNVSLLANGADGGVVDIAGNVTATTGAVTIFADDAVMVTGDVMAHDAVLIQTGLEGINVTGNVVSSDDSVTIQSNTTGLMAVAPDIVIGGNVSAAQQVSLQGPANVTVTGTITSTMTEITLTAGNSLQVDGAVFAATDIVAISMTGTMSFGSTVNADTGSIKLTNGDTLILNGIVTAGTEILQNGAGSVQLCADVTAGSNITFQSAIILCNTITVASTAGGDIAFQSTVDSAANQSFGLTVNTSGQTNFNAAVGSGLDQALGFLTTDADGTTVLNGNVTTAGEQLYGDVVQLTSAVTLTAVDTDADGEGIEFGSTVNGGAQQLTMVGGVAFAGAVTNVGTLLADHLDSESTIVAGTVHVTGTSDLGDSVTTSGEQQYDGTVLLTSDVIATSTGDANVTFGGTVNGARSLTVNTGGVTTFAGIIGGSTALTALVTDAPGSTIINTTSVRAGTIDFHDVVALQQSTNIQGTTSVTFYSTVNGNAGTETLTVTSSGAASFLGAITQLQNVTINADGQTLVAANVTITGTLSTNAAGLTKIDAASISAGTVQFNDAVELCQDLAITAGRITFGSTLNEAAGATSSDLTLTITNPALSTGDITFSGAVGGTTALDSVTITTANDVTFSSTVRLVGDLQQQNGTGTSTFNGTSGTGIGGQFVVNTRTIIFNTVDVVTVGAIQLTTQDTLTLNANAGLNAGSSTITLLVNQDNTGNHDFTQAGTAIIRTFNNTVDAVRILVGTTGSATIGDIRAGTVGGVVSITADRQIRDNLAGEGPNITAHAAALRAGTGIGVDAGGDFNTDVDQLAFSCTGAGANISNLGDLTLTAVDGLTTSLASGGGTLFASGSLTIAMNTLVGGTFNFIAGDDVAGINDLIISANITHLSGLGEISFQAGDDIIQTAGTIQCIGAPVGGLSRINFTADHEASGADGDRGGITQTGGSIIASELQIRSFDAVSMNQGNDTDILAAVVTGAGQSFSFHDINNLTIYRIPGVGGVVGLTTNGGDVTLNVGGHLILGGTGEDILAAGAIVTITAGNGFGEGADSTITAGQLLLLGTGTFTVNQRNDVDILAANINGTLAYSDADDIIIGTVSGTSGIITSNDDVKLSTTAGNLTLNDDIALGSGNLTLNVNGAVTQTTEDVITASGLLLMGVGTVMLNEVGNNVTTLAASYNGTISFTDADTLIIGTVTDGPSGMTASGITTSNDDVKLTVLTGNLTIGDNVGTAGADDITLAGGDLTFVVQAGNITQTANNNLAANGLQIRGAGIVTLNNAANNVDVLTANWDGTLAYTDANGLTIGTVTDNAASPGVTTSGITTTGDDVKLTVLANGLVIDDNVALGSGDLTLNVTGAVTQNTNDNITAHGLQLFGAGTVTLNNAGNNVDVLAASYHGTIAYTDANALTVGTVTDDASGMFAVGITTSSDDVKLTVLSNGLVIDDDISLGTADLTLNVIGAVTQNTGDDITARGLQILGAGTVTLNNAGNNIDVLAANYNGTIAYTDANTLSIGTVVDEASAMSTVGITTSSDDVKLTVLANGLVIDDDVSLGSGDLTLNMIGAVTQNAGDDITAHGLQLLGTGAVILNNTTNNVDVLAANYNGTIAYTDANALTIGTVTDDASGMTTVGINTSSDDVKLTVLSNGLAIDDDVLLGVADFTLNVTGAVTQNAGDDITARGLQLLGTGTVTLNNSGNNVDVLAANYNGAIAYTDTNAVTIGTVTDDFSGMATSGITTSNDNVTLTTGGLLTLGSGAGQDIAVGNATVILNTLAGGVLEQAGSTITATNLAVLGIGVYTLNQNNNVVVLAANIDGTLAYTDTNALSIGTVGTTVGITTANDDVKLTVLAGGLVINEDVSLGGGDLTLNVIGAVTQNAGKDITAQGLQLLGTGTVTLNNSGNNVAVLAANYNGEIACTDANGLTIGTVADDASGMTTGGITTSNDNVTLTTGGLLTLGSGAGQDITLGNATLVFNSANGVTEAAGSILVARNLLLTGMGNFTLTDNNDIATLATDIAGNLNYVDANDLEISTVNAVDGITTGVPTNGGNVIISAAGNLTVNQSINTQGGAGGVISVSGGTINAALIAGAGNITLNGGNPDLIINVAQSSATTMNLSATRDVIINAVVTTTGIGADVLVTADSDANGVGGVQVTAAGQIVSANEIVLKGSDLFVTMGSSDSIWIEADGANDQLLAAGNITLQNQATIPTTADILIDGRIHSTGGDIVINARDGIFAKSAILADNGSVTFGRAVVLTGALQVTAGNDVLFVKTVNDDGNAGTSSALNVTAAGTTTFTGAVGNVAALSSVVTNGGGITEICGGSVTTTGVQVYADAVVLCANTTLTSTSSGNIVFQNTVNGDGVADRSLIINTTGITDFQGAVGNMHALAGLKTDAPGTTQIGGGSIITMGLQTFSDDVLLTNNAVLTSTASGTIQFLKTVNGTHDLTINTAGMTSFQMAVGSTQALASLTTDAAGSTRITGGLIRTTGIQSFGDALTIAANTLFTTTAASANGANITFQSMVDTAGHDMTVDSGTQGNLTVADALTGGGTLLVQQANIAQFAAITVDTLTIQMATTAVTFHGPVNVTNSAAVNSNGTITQESTFDAGFDVTYTAAGVILVQGSLTAGHDITGTSMGASIDVSGQTIAANDVTLTSFTSTTLTAPVTATSGDLAITAGTTISAMQAVTAATSIVLTSTNGTTLGIDGDICTTAVGGFVTINGPLITAANILTNKGMIGLTGPVTLTGNVTWDSDRFETGGANITVNGTIATTGKNLTIDAGSTGNLALQATLSGGGHMLVEQGNQQAFAAIHVDQLTIQEATTSVRFTAAVTVTNSASVNSLGTITQNNTFIAGQNVSYTAIGAVVVQGSLTAGVNVSLISSAASINLTAAATATNGNLTAQAATTLTATQALKAGTDLTITSGGATNVSGTITAGDDIAMTSTSASIDLSGTVIAGNDVSLMSAVAATLTAPITATNGDLSVTAGTSISATKALTAGTSVVLTATDSTILGVDGDVCTTTVGGFVTINGSLITAANILTNNGAITLTGPVTLTGDVVLDSDRFETGGANITVQGTIATAGKNLTLDAGSTGDLTFQSSVTGGGNLLVEQGDEQLFQAAVSVDNLTIQQATTSVTFAALVTVAQSANINSLGTISQNSTFVVGQDVIYSAVGAITVEDVLTAGNDVTLTSSASSITLHAPVTATIGNVTAMAGTTFTATQALSAGTDVTLTSGGAINIANTVTAGDDIAITSTGGTISLSDAVLAANDVTLSAGTSLTATASITATNGNLSAQAGTAISATQMLTAGNQVSLIAGTVLTLAETADIVAGAGGVVLTGPQILTAAEITTNSGNVAVTGAVTLTGDVSIDTGAAGSLLVTGTIDAQAAFAPSLFLSNGTGDITVTGNIGSVGSLKALEISDARNVTFGGAITANHLLQQSGLGTTTIVGAVNTFDAQGIQLTTQSIQFAAGTSSMDSHGQIITLTADAITLPTTFTRAIGSTVTLQTLHDTTAIGLNDASQNLNFTDQQLDTIDTQNLIIGSASQTAGIKVGTDGSVTLNENLTLLTAGRIGVFGALSLDGTNNLLLDAGDDIRIDGSVATAAGNMQLLADDDVTMGVSGLVTSSTGNVFVRADADGNSNGAGGGITMTDGARIVVGTGTLTMLADETIVLGQLVSSNTTANAIAVTSQHGGIVDGGDSTGPNIVTTSNTAVVTLTAASGIGSQTGLAADAALETQVNLLSITNSNTGNIGIHEVNAITLLGVEQNGSGAVLLTAGGTMTVALGGPGVQANGGKITLVTTGAASDLVLNAAVTSRGGDIAIQVGDDLAQAVTAPITSQGGNITVSVADDANLAAMVASSGGNIAVSVGSNLTQMVTAPISTRGGSLTETVGGNGLHQGAISTTGGNVSFDIGGNFTQTTTAPLSTGGGSLTAMVDGSMNLAAAMSTSGGAVNFTVGNDFTQAATAPLTTSNGNLAMTVGGALFMQDGALTDAGNGTMAMQVVGNVTIGQLRTTNASGNAVLIRSTQGGIIDGGDLLGANIIANTVGAIVTLNAMNGIGSTLGAGADAALETQINSLDARNAMVGNIAIAEADALLIRSVVQSATGNVTVQSTGDLTLVAGQSGVSATSGNVTLMASAPASSVRIESTIQTNSGKIAVSAANNVTLTTPARILSNTGDVTIIADADQTLGGNGGALTMVDGAVINAGIGNVALRADGNITIGQVVTSSTVSLFSTSAGIVDGGDTGGRDIIAANLAIRAATGVGASNTLETAIEQLAVQNHLAGGIRIDNNTGGLLTIGTVDGLTGITNTGTNAAVINLVNNGAVTVNGNVRNATGGDVFLQATNNGGNDDDLVVNAVIAATNGNGNIELQAGHDLLINDTGSVVDISVVNGGKILGNAVGNVVVGSDVVIQSSTGAISALNPELINVSTPQITALGIGTILMTVQRPFEIGTVIVIDWGDGTIETFVVTEANQQDLVFDHKYLGPPNPLNPAQDIPLKMTILAPGFTTGAKPSPTAGTQLVTNGSYDPNIQFFADGQVVTPATFGALNETVMTAVFKTPGDGLASFAFDLTPPVEYLTFPEQAKIDASLLAAPQAPAQANTLNDLISRADELLVDERVVLLEVFAPDGKLLERVVLAEDVLDRLDGVVRGLPDGHYRFVLREAGETRTRLLQEFDVRQGHIAGGNDNTGDRPPSLMTNPMMPSPAPELNNPAPADALQPENGAAAASREDGNSLSWSGWRTRSAWRSTVSVAEFVSQPHEVSEVLEDDETLLVTAAETTGEPAFGRGARLLRKHGMF